MEKENEKKVQPELISTRDILAKEKKVRIRIPKDPLNPQIPSMFVYINELSYEIALGEEVEVPESIYKILVNSGRI